ncbi:hypothetical protein L596_013567 [Steinernema carpocapsae]|uniref:Uncharacterized protein n=1 Tax=Steinernema carpocapsae TaxID=34508 RepID=A0A4U5P0J7_STECR|nr:hypothetical protein L596_013567 [Steinernema carpocapsae]
MKDLMVFAINQWQRYTHNLLTTRYTHNQIFDLSFFTKLNTLNNNKYKLINQSSLTEKYKPSMLRYQTVKLTLNNGTIYN